MWRMLRRSGHGGEDTGGQGTNCENGDATEDHGFTNSAMPVLDVGQFGQRCGRCRFWGTEIMQHVGDIDGSWDGARREPVAVGVVELTGDVRQDLLLLVVGQVGQQAGDMTEVPGDCSGCRLAFHGHPLPRCRW